MTINWYRTIYSRVNTQFTKELYKILLFLNISHKVVEMMEEIVHIQSQTRADYLIREWAQKNLIFIWYINHPAVFPFQNVPLWSVYIFVAVLSHTS